jgi:hypothetical protein
VTTAHVAYPFSHPKHVLSNAGTSAHEPSVTMLEFNPWTRISMPMLDYLLRRSLSGDGDKQSDNDGVRQDRMLGRLGWALCLPSFVRPSRNPLTWHLNSRQLIPHAEHAILVPDQPSKDCVAGCRRAS